jgi:Ca2+-dependent lipid-binding protein
LNGFGIDHDSKLTVEVIEASDLLSGHYESQADIPFIQLTCGKLKQETTSHVNITNSCPKWCQTFEFPIEMGAEDLYIDVYNFKTKNNSNHFLGKNMIPLHTLKSQNKSDSYHPLYGTDQKLIKSRLRLSIQWIHNRVLYFDEIFNQVDDYLMSLS